MTNLREIVKNQKDYFNSGETKNLAFREKSLRHLNRAVEVYEKKITEALKTDLNKSPYEAYISEIGNVYHDLRYTLKHLRSWAKPRKVRTPLVCFPAASYIYPEPYGVALIISPWNYPFQLAIGPVVGAMAAGNCCILKPSEFAPCTSAVIVEMLGESFQQEYMAVVEGDTDVSKALLNEKFEYIFFTGSSPVGRKVMTAAAGHLTPVTLELGGKSPCLVDREVRIDTAARKIVSGKFINAGQSCIAPDYLLVHKDIKSTLIEHVKKHTLRFYGENPKESKDYPRIINRRHFERLNGLLQNSHIIFGGDTDPEELYMAPTIVDPVAWEDPLMQDEIFGPILPVITYTDLQDAIQHIKSLPEPLALYFFSENKARQKEIISKISFGGGCINDTLLHYVSPHLPFGGVGGSGIGSYHGKAGFDTFTHQKSVLKNTLRFDLPLRYPPYGSLKLIKKILR